MYTPNSNTVPPRVTLAETINSIPFVLAKFLPALLISCLVGDILYGISVDVTESGGTRVGLVLRAGHLFL